MNGVSRWIGLGLMAAGSAVSPAFAQTTTASPAPVEAAPAPGNIQRILVEGMQRIEPATVASYLTLQQGDPFDPERIDLSLKALFATGLFADVRIAQRGGDLVVTVVENPIVNQVIFEGNSALSTEKLEKEIQARPRAIFTQSRVQQDVGRILELYRRSGRFGATVTPKVREQQQNRVDVIFEITEGPQTGVRSINFLGNQSFSDRRLRETLVTEESRWWRFFSNNDNYDPDRFEFDREQLRKLYAQNGYADFRIVSAVAELTPDQKDFLITVAIDEGRKYKWGKISVTSENERLDKDFLRAVVPIREGDDFNGDLIETAVDQITFAAGTLGYAFVDVRQRLEPNPETGLVDVTFNVDEGPRVYIEKIDIIGNTRTLDEVIRREVRVVEGDAFNRVLLDRSRNRIRALGFFKEVEITEKPGALPDRTVVEVKVEEQPTGELAFALGFSSADAYLVDISYTERNLRGRGQFLRFRVGASSRTQQVDIRFTEPRFLGRNIAGSIDIFSIYNDLIREASFETQSTGFGLRAGFAITEYMSLGLRYTLRSDDVRVDPFQCASTTPPLICREAGSFLTSVAGYTFNWDRRNDPRRPTRGFDMTLSQDLAGLGGEINYLRSEFQGRAYYGFRPGWTLQGTLSSGYIFSWGDDTVRINDRFFKGGNDFRGFEVAGLGPREVILQNGTTAPIIGDALGGKFYAIGSLELSFPLPLPEQYGIGSGLFIDAGTVGILDDRDRVTVRDGLNGITLIPEDAAALRISAGLSLYWDSPFGPLRFDFSNIVRKKYYDRTETFRFGARTQF